MYVFNRYDEGACGEDVAERDEDCASLVSFTCFENAFRSGERSVDDTHVVALLHLAVEGEVFYSVVEYLYDVAEIVKLVVAYGHGGVVGISDEANVGSEEVVAAYGKYVCLCGFEEEVAAWHEVSCQLSFPVTLVLQWHEEVCKTADCSVVILEPAQFVDDVRCGIASVHDVPVGLELYVFCLVLHRLLSDTGRSLGFSDICKMLRDKRLSICRCFLFQLLDVTKRLLFVCSCVVALFIKLYARVLKNCDTFS